MELLSIKDMNYDVKVKNGLFSKKVTFKLEDINFNIDTGEAIAIIGDNGSGKSLLANLLVGTQKPKTGEMKLNGANMPWTRSKRKTQNIRMIFQHIGQALNPALTIAKILEEPLILNTKLSSKEREKKINQTLLLVGMLTEHKHFYRHMLSDGQLQRIALARALILDPKVIVADEPFAALDPSVRSQTVNLLLKLQRELGLGFIFISHNLGLVRHISDKILVMQNGKIIEQGKTEAVFDWPREEYTKSLFNAYYSLINQK
jgi:cationic peptide transport system ATP-binding protein